MLTKQQTLNIVDTFWNDSVFTFQSIFRSPAACSFLCFKSDDCSAFSYKKETQTCQLGLKGRSIPALSPNDISTTIYTKPGPVFYFKYM
jgi:hypothetical protein